MLNLISAFFQECSSRIKCGSHWKIHWKMPNCIILFKLLLLFCAEESNGSREYSILKNTWCLIIELNEAAFVALGFTNFFWSHLCNSEIWYDFFEWSSKMIQFSMKCFEIQIFAYRFKRCSVCASFVRKLHVTDHPLAI